VSGLFNCCSGNKKNYIVGRAGQEEENEHDSKKHLGKTVISYSSYFLCIEQKGSMEYKRSWKGEKEKLLILFLPF